jgi:probable rRNA maturation factor
MAFIRRVIQEASRVREVAARLPNRPVTVAVRLTDDSEMERLNTYEHHATDVLSFSGWGEHLGDIAISWPAVQRQARDYGHTAETELALLCVHALLHLLGWDHYEEIETREMWRLTLKGLKRSGLTISPR